MRVHNVIIHPRKGLRPGELSARRKAMDELRPTTHPQMWVTRTEAAELLDVSERSVDRHRATGELGYYRGPVPGFDAALRFWRSDVERLALMQNRGC